MFGKPFYHHTLRKIVASFGSIFANIYVIKKSQNTNEIERIKVPLSYGPAEKYLVRTNEDSDLDRSFAVKLPRMSFEIKSIEYDAQRKLNTIKRQFSPQEESQGTVNHQYQGVPYRIGMELSILSKYIDDANQIVEQIIPWFTPAFTISINSIPEMSYKDDVPITLTSVNVQDNYEDEWKTRRDVVWTLNFDIKMMFYGPITDRDLITKTIVDTYAATGVDLDNIIQRQTIPRSIRSTTEISPNSVKFNEVFGYIETTQSFSDNLIRDPATGIDVPTTLRIPAPLINSRENVYNKIVIR